LADALRDAAFVPASTLRLVEYRERHVIAFSAFSVRTYFFARGKPWVLPERSRSAVCRLPLNPNSTPIAPASAANPNRLPCDRPIPAMCYLRYASGLF
jgi:hypothetical protein